MRVLIVDDHPLFRDGMRGLLESVADLEVAGEAASGEEAIALAASLQPDVVLMDLNMPPPDGIEATRRIVTDSPRANVLVVTMYEDDESVFSALRAGARGYVLKGASQAETLRAHPRRRQRRSDLWARDCVTRDALFRHRVWFAGCRGGLSRAHRARDRDPAADRPGTHQRRHRRPARAELEDGAQPRVEHLRQIASRRPRPGGHSRARSGPALAAFPRTRDRVLPKSRDTRRCGGRV